MMWLVGNGIHIMRFKGFFKIIIPESLRNLIRYLLSYPGLWFRLRLNYAYDRKRYWKYSTADSSLDRRVNLEAWIMGDYHKIEKALALRSPRPGFGKAVVGRLANNLEAYINLYGKDDVCTTANNVLSEYLEFNERNGLYDNLLRERVEKLNITSISQSCDLNQGGTLLVGKKEILKNSLMDLSKFFDSRYSIRQFDSKPVSRELIERAVLLARKTPSVCNRQSWKVYAFSEPELRNKVIACQKGNRGFGDQIQTILIVTSNLETFYSIGERNQCWIDGGMFSMSLVYSLHSLGLGSICLNWSVEKKADYDLHKVASIPDSEVIIMLIGVGYLPESLTVAESHRKPVEEILVCK